MSEIEEQPRATEEQPQVTEPEEASPEREGADLENGDQDPKENRLEGLSRESRELYRGGWWWSTCSLAS